MKNHMILSFGLYLPLIETEIHVCYCKEQSFTIAFMTNIGYVGIGQNGYTYDGACKNLSLFFAATEKTKCSVSVPKNSSFQEIVSTIDPGNDVLEVNLPRWLALSGSGVELKGIRVICNNVIRLYGINSCLLNTDGFSVIPNNHLGKEYYAFTVSPTENYSQVAVVGYLDNTTLTIHLRCTDCNVTFGNVTYTSGSFILAVLDAYESFQIQSRGNLAGAYISSNNPVSVFSGNVRTGINGGSGQEHLVLHVPPIQAWGKQYVIVATPLSTQAATFSDSLFLVASANHTDCNIICTGTNALVKHHYVVNAGQIIQTDLSLDSYCAIETNETVLAVQAISPEKRPSFLLLTPRDRYSANYSFTTPKTSVGSSFRNYFIYVIEESVASHLMLDSQIIQINSRQIPGTNLKGGHIEITNNHHVVYHVTNQYAQFNGAILGLAYHESYAISLGWNWKVITKYGTSNAIIFAVKF